MYHIWFLWYWDSTALLAYHPLHVVDFVCFYKDDTHADKWGDDKYSGGRSGSSSNWPGFGGRPALKIPASRFVFYFKSDGSNNGNCAAKRILI